MAESLYIGYRTCPDEMHRIVSATILLVLVGSSLSSVFLPSVNPATTNTTDLLGKVSGERIMQTIEDLEDFGSRSFYLNSSREAADYIDGRFAELGLSVVQQEFMAGEYPCSNVVAGLSGTDSASAHFLFGAHYDSENRGADNLALVTQLPAPGADDDASGVAVVIELATLVADTRLKNTIKFVAFGAEESGFDGSGAWGGSAQFVLGEKESGVSYQGTVILDMVGYRQGEQNFAFGIVNSLSGPLPSAIGSAVDEFGLDLRFTLLDAPWVSYSDHYPFWLNGYPSMLMIEEISTDTHVPVNPHYHTENDTSDKLSQEQMAEITKAIVAGLMDVAKQERDSNLTLIATSLGLAGVSAAAVFVHNRKRKAGEE